MTAATARPSTLAGRNAPPHPPIDPNRCTYLHCDKPVVRRLQPSTGGRPWFGCRGHWQRMEKALLIGMSGATNGGAWIEITVRRTKRPA